MLTKRVYIHEKIYDEFRDKMVEFTKTNIKTGAGTEAGVVVGPLQNKMQWVLTHPRLFAEPYTDCRRFDKVKDMYAQIEKSNWKAALAGSATQSSEGYFITPAIIDNPPEDSRIVVEEPFGPIVPILKWSDEEDVIDRANALRSGLGASVWSKDLERAERMARRLEAGSVWVNSQ
jgi:acyl-CoA reductase-like NAD-dependent aldehyde dehydrogenase